jgi:hypothetical protein
LVSLFSIATFPNNSRLYLIGITTLKYFRIPNIDSGFA